MSKNMDERIRKARLLLQNPHAYVGGDGTYEALISDAAGSHKAFRYASQNPWAYLDDEGNIAFPADIKFSAQSPRIEIEALLNGKRQDSNFSRSEIESIVRNLQIQLWLKRFEIWPDVNSIDPIDALDPATALESIGYSVHEDDALGMYIGVDGTFEVAGLFDKPTSSVRVSRQLPHQTRSFTMAHELGHAILHAGVTMHRDRALDGSMIRARDLKEYQADVFASLFLLPAKQARLAMRNRFLTESFKLNEATAFALNMGSLTELRGRFRDLRMLSRTLAAATYYNGRHFISMAEHFGVSVETMAIRLEELTLLQL